MVFQEQEINQLRPTELCCPVKCRLRESVCERVCVRQPEES